MTISMNIVVPVARLVIICKINVPTTFPSLRVWPEAGYWKTSKGERAPPLIIVTDTHTQKKETTTAPVTLLFQSNIK